MKRYVPLLSVLALCAVVVVVLLLRGGRPRGAEAYFERGNALAQAGKYAEACQQQ